MPDTDRNHETPEDRARRESWEMSEKDITDAADWTLALLAGALFIVLLAVAWRWMS